MAASPDTELRGYDVEALARTFDILRATGGFEAFVKECEANGTKVYVVASFAEETKQKLIAAMPVLEKDRARYSEIFKKAPPDATIKIRAPDECPACPHR